MSPRRGAHSARPPRVKEIRTNVVEPTAGARLKAPMDTGIELGGGAAAARRRTRTDRRRESAAGGRWSLVVLALLAVFLISAVVIARVGDTVGPAAAAVSVGGALPMPAAPVATRLPPLTPVFASYGGMRIHLPIAPANITAVAFHQSSYDDGLPMDILVPVVSGAAWKAGAPARAAAVASAAAAAAAVPTGTTVVSAPAASLSDIWQGEVLKLYRTGRKGTPNTAVDVGGQPGTTVMAPVDGVIAQVKPYKLYGKYDDYEIHIAPAGATDFEVVMLHIDGPVVKVGDKVTGGRTHVGVVRNLSRFESLQLGEYTPGAKGDHTHVQVNKLKPGVTPYTAPQTIDDTATITPQ
jgi:murein DD-endopeptidase MepM/ murein hydrolase activator NlpD